MKNVARIDFIDWKLVWFPCSTRPMGIQRVC